MRRSGAVLFFLLMRLYSEANVVSVDSAKSVALNFYKTTTNSSATHSATLGYTHSESDGTVDFYVFNLVHSPGFVIVSAADNVTPILAYSTESAFDPSLSQIGIQGWMKRTGDQIHQLVLNSIPAAIGTTAQWAAYRSGSQSGLRSASISPMLSTTWAQEPFYNMLCPYDYANLGLSVTGCEATAMAQIMKYWSYPARGTGSFSYKDSVNNTGYSLNIGFLGADFGSTTYQWSQMPSSLSGNDSAVATLMYHCGVSMASNYSSRGTSAYSQYPGHPCAVNSFIRYFGYDSLTIEYVQAANYTTSGWLTMIQNELNQGRPVLYSGRDTGGIGGHAWVCDGYDANGNLHMNWGWGGMDDGYYLSTDLDPDGLNWSWGEAAIIGIKPGDVTGVNNLASDQAFTVYPNPASTSITIAGNTSNSPVEYAIYDVLGNRMAQGSLSEKSGTVNTSSYTTGMYFAKLQSGQKETALRFLIEK